MKSTQILLTNDDGIRSPGLWSAAQALSALGYVHVAAPRDQYSGAGRSLPSTSDGIIQVQEMQVNGQAWQVHAVGGSPAQAVLHGILEIMPEPPALVVSGINYGENVGTGVTVSGTVGAAMEAAAMGFPALAISVETEPRHHLSYSDEVDFSTAAYFTAYFGRMLLEQQMPEDVHVVKVDVPCDATPETPWEVTRLSPQRYYKPLRPTRKSWAVRGVVGYHLEVEPTRDAEDTDVYVLLVKRHVSVTPITLDLTARINLRDFEKQLKGG